MSTRNVVAAWARLPNEHCPGVAADAIRCNFITVTYNLFWPVAGITLHILNTDRRVVKTTYSDNIWNSICMWHFNTPGEMDVFCIAKSWHWSHYGDFRGKKRSFVSLTWSEITNVIFLQTLWYFLQAVKEMSYIYLYTFMHLLLSSMW